MINPCACLGPRQGEPYCMCEMIDRGIRTKKDYAMSESEKVRLNEALSKVFDWK